LNEQNFALLADLRISNVVASKNTESLQEWLIRKGTLKARSGVLYQPIQDNECTNLAVGVAILAGSLLVILFMSISSIRTAFCGLPAQLQWDQMIECG